MPPASTLIGFVWAHNCCTPVRCRNAPAGVKTSMATCSPEAVVETEGCGRSSRGNQSVRDSIIRDGDVGKDFANSEDPAARRTFGQARILPGRHIAARNKRPLQETRRGGLRSLLRLGQSP